MPGTWGSKVTDCNVMPKEFVKNIYRKDCTCFDRFEPIYIVSGDTDFDTPEAVSYYRDALDVLCEKSPHTLKTMHIKRGYDFSSGKNFWKNWIFICSSPDIIGKGRIWHMFFQKISVRNIRKNH